MLKKEPSVQLIERDLAYNWHPCSQMKDYESFPPVEIRRAEGAYLHLADGRRVVDAMSSWWCKALGHRHPDVMAAMTAQMSEMCHAIFANTTNKVIVDLSERLCQRMPGMDKVFYASDGSCAVEIALKMSMQLRFIHGQTHRNHVLNLQNGYHGETLFAMAVSDCELYKRPFAAHLPQCPIITNIPYVSGITDPLWADCSHLWPEIEAQLAPYAKTATAFILEPVLQGAGGMLIYSADFLRRLRAWCDTHDVHLIADEIMTGLGRTGQAFACNHAKILPDFMCLSKGLTSGEIPMSCVLTQNKHYEPFYDDYETGKAFMHSHTQTGNVLAASAALATLNVMEGEGIFERAQALSTKMQVRFQDIATRTGKLNNLRTIGGMIAGDLVTDNADTRLGYAVFQQAIQEGAWLRPLGNTLYWLPPLNIDDDTLDTLALATEHALLKTYRKDAHENNKKPVKSTSSPGVSRV